MPAKAETLSLQESQPLDGEEIIIVPDIDLSSYPNVVYPAGIQYFRPELYLQNTRILKLCLGYYQALSFDFARNFRLTTYPITEIPAQKAISVIKKIEASESVRQTLARTDFRFPRSLPSFDALKKFYHDVFSRLKGNSCLISSTHTTDIELASSIIEKGFPPEKIGFVIIDHHFDGVGTDNPPFSNTSVINHLIKMGIRAVSVIGIPQEQVLHFTKGQLTTSSNQRKEIKEILSECQDQSYLLPEVIKEGIDTVSTYKNFYLPHQDKLSLAQGFFSQQGKTGERKLIKAVDEQFEWIIKKGIKYLLISLDIDAVDFQENISATSYTPFSKLLAMGIQDLSQILSRFGFKTIEQFEKAVRQHNHLRSAIKTEGRKGATTLRREKVFARHQLEDYLLRYKLFPAILNSEQACVFVIAPASHLPETFYNQEILSTNQGGFKIREQELIIRRLKQLCIENGINFGIEIEKGKITGSINEVSGIDLDGNTASMVLRLAEVLNH